MDDEKLEGEGVVCTCNRKDYELHSCPYQADIFNDDDPEYCSCCPYCEEQCAMDI